MGISLVSALFLVRQMVNLADARRGLILGRQKLHLKGRKMSSFITEAAKLDCVISPKNFVQDDGFTEGLFRALGYPAMEAMDFTDQEGAQHIHDLNKPVPKELREQFDIVIDGGTTEHIFHIGQALDSCHAMLKPGGLFLSCVSADGWFGHGFFQTGPDVPWRYWHHARGYEMLEVSLVCRKDPLKLIVIGDPTGRRRGGERALSGPHMLLTAARKPIRAPTYRVPVQSHYVSQT